MICWSFLKLFQLPWKKECCYLSTSILLTRSILTNVTAIEKKKKKRWKENTLRNQELTAGGRIMSQLYGKLRSWNACLHLSQGVAWKDSSETWNYMKMALFYTMLKIRADYSKQATKVLQEKLCGAMTLSASRDQSFMSNNSVLAEGWLLYSCICWVWAGRPCW